MLDQRSLFLYKLSMPIFEYDCKKCGNVSEILSGVSATEPEIVCSHCGSTQLTKKFSVANFAVAGARARTEAPPCGAAPGSTCGHCQYTD
jgi:putative FmdB family regulatory protein